jgi:hypothetical protein
LIIDNFNPNTINYQLSTFNYLIMASGKYYQISIGGIVVSSNGTNTGVRCRVSVENVNDLLRNYTGSQITSGNGSSVDQIIPYTAGKDFSVVFFKPTIAVWNSLKTLFDNYAGNGVPFAVIGTGAPGNFNVNAKPIINNPYDWKGFSATHLKELILRMQTV